MALLPDRAPSRQRAVSFGLSLHGDLGVMSDRRDERLGARPTFIRATVFSSSFRRMQSSPAAAGRPVVVTGTGGTLARNGCKPGRQRRLPGGAWSASPSMLASHPGFPGRVELGGPSRWRRSSNQDMGCAVWRRLAERVAYDPRSAATWPASSSPTAPVPPEETAHQPAARAGARPAGQSDWRRCGRRRRCLQADGPQNIVDAGCRWRFHPGAAGAWRPMLAQDRSTPGRRASISTYRCRRLRLWAMPERSARCRGRADAVAALGRLARPLGLRGQCAAPRAAAGRDRQTAMQNRTPTGSIVDAQRARGIDGASALPNGTGPAARCYRGPGIGGCCVPTRRREAMHASRCSRVVAGVPFPTAHGDVSEVGQRADANGAPWSSAASRRRTEAARRATIRAAPREAPGDRERDVDVCRQQSRWSTGRPRCAVWTVVSRPRDAVRAQHRHGHIATAIPNAPGLARHQQTDRRIAHSGWTHRRPGGAIFSPPPTALHRADARAGISRRRTTARVQTAAVAAEFAEAWTAHRRILPSEDSVLPLRPPVSQRGGRCRGFFSKVRRPGRAGGGEEICRGGQQAAAAGRKSFCRCPSAIAARKLLEAGVSVSVISPELQRAAEAAPRVSDAGASRQPQRDRCRSVRPSRVASSARSRGHG